MKNKFNISVFIFILFVLLQENSISDDDFIFESKSIELIDNGNIIKADNNVEITTNNGLKINSKQSTYSKITKKLLLIGDVVVFDKKNNITIESDYIEYDKALEIIVSKEKTLINIDNDFNLKTKNIYFLKLKNVIKSDEKSVLADKFNNIVETENFIYSLNNKQFRSKNLFITDKQLNKYFSNEAAIDLNNNEITAKDIQVYFSKSGDLGNHARLKGN